MAEVYTMFMAPSVWVEELPGGGDTVEASQVMSVTVVWELMAARVARRRWWRRQRGVETVADKGGGPGCFISGTPVLLADGSG